MLQLSRLLALLASSSRPRLVAPSPYYISVHLLSHFVQRTMCAGPWLESLGWGTGRVLNPKKIYPAVSAEVPAAAAAEAYAEAAQGRPVQGKGTAQEPPPGSKGAAQKPPAESKVAAPEPGKKRKAAGTAEDTAVEVAAPGGMNAAAASASAAAEVGEEEVTAAGAGRKPVGGTAGGGKATSGKAEGGKGAGGKTGGKVAKVRVMYRGADKSALNRGIGVRSRLEQGACSIYVDS